MNLVTRYYAFFLGILLIATGCCFPGLYHWGMDCASTPKAATLIHRLAIGGLPVILIFLLAVCDGIRILLLTFQRCPHCHRWYFFWRSELVAGNQCPYCRNRLYIPGKIGEQPYEKPSCEGIVYIYFVLATFLLSALACISIIMNASGSGLLYTQLTWIGVGTAWIILFPVSVRLYNKFICQQRGKDRRKNVCPHCHEYYDPLILRMSGNCSFCGSQLDSEWCNAPLFSRAALHTYGTIKKQSTTDKVDSAKFHTTDQVQIENVFIGKNLGVQLLQRIFKCPSPGLMFSNVAATGKSPGIILRCKAEIVTPTPDKRYPRSQGIGKNFVHTGRYAYQKRQKTAGDQSQRPRRPTLMQI